MNFSQLNTGCKYSKTILGDNIDDGQLSFDDAGLNVGFWVDPVVTTLGWILTAFNLDLIIVQSHVGSDPNPPRTSWTT